MTRRQRSRRAADASAGRTSERLLTIDTKAATPCAAVARQDVAQGGVIGAVGGTGLATAPHLHWEIVVHGVRVDPLPWTQGEIGP